jgi:hypothetical protein
MHLQEKMHHTANLSTTHTNQLYENPIQITNLKTLLKHTPIFFVIIEYPQNKYKYDPKQNNKTQIPNKQAKKHHPHPTKRNITKPNNTNNKPEK